MLKRTIEEYNENGVLMRRIVEEEIGYPPSWVYNFDEDPFYPGEFTARTEKDFPNYILL